MFLGVLAGLVAGTLAGSLFAPAKGSKIRKRILKRATNYKESLSEKLRHFVNEINEKVENVKGEVSALTNKKMVKPEEAEKNKKTVSN